MKDYKVKKTQIAHELLSNGYYQINDHKSLTLYQITGKEFLDAGWKLYDKSPLNPKDKLVDISNDDDRFPYEFSNTYNPDAVVNLSDYDNNLKNYLNDEFVENEAFDDFLFEE